MGTITFPQYSSAAEVLAFPLTVLFNYALLFGVFPESLKIAKIVPIHKGNSKFSVSTIIDLFQYSQQF